MTDPAQCRWHIPVLLDATVEWARKSVARPWMANTVIPYSANTVSTRRDRCENRIERGVGVEPVTGQENRGRPKLMSIPFSFMGFQPAEPIALSPLYSKPNRDIRCDLT